MRLPYYGYGNELIGAVYEFKKGKYVLGAQFGTELQEEFAVGSLVSNVDLPRGAHLSWNELLHRSNVE